MGIGLLIAGSLAVSAVSTISQIRAQKDAAKARKEANKIQGAGEENRNRLARRRAVKEARIRRARILSAAQGRGASGSSGQFGATSAIGSNLGAGLAQQSSDILATQGVSSALQREEDALGRGRRAQAFGNLVSAGLDFGIKLH